MKKLLPIAAAAAVLVIVLFGDYGPRSFSVENVAAVQIMDGTTGKSVTVTDAATVNAIVENVTGLRYRYQGRVNSSGWRYSLTFLNAAGESVGGLTVLGGEGQAVIFNSRRFRVMDGGNVDIQNYAAFLEH